MGVNFQFSRYIRRVVRYMIYLTVLLFIIVAIFSLVTKQDFSLYNIFRPGTGIQLLLFTVAISLIYPFFGYVNKRVYLPTSFEEEREKIDQIFKENRYRLDCDGSTSLKYRHTSPFIRVMRMYEDAIVIDISDNPIKLEGSRKEVYRMVRIIEYAIRDSYREE